MQVYSNAMINAPQLSNTWGSITAILDFIFQDFAQMNFTKIEAYDNGIAKITYNQTTDTLVLGQTINVTGTINYNKEYLVTAISTDGLTATIENRSILKSTAPETGAFKMKLTACPVTKLYGSAADQRIVFQLKNGWVARFDDRPLGPLLTPTVVWSDDRGKFARVALAQGSANMDSLTGMQIPYNSSMPSLNIAPVNDYVGIAGLLYNCPGNTSNIFQPNLVTATNYYRPSWNIVVDDNFFWFNVMIDNTSIQTNAATFTRNIMISEYDSWYSSTGKGMSLYAYSTQLQNDTKYNATSWNFSVDNSNILFKAPNSTQINTWLYDDSLTSNTYIPFALASLFNTCSLAFYSGSPSATTSINLTSNKVIISDTILLNSTNNIRGTNRYLTWIATQWDDASKERLYGKIYNLENNRYFIVHQYSNTTDPNSTSIARGLIKLKVPK